MKIQKKQVLTVVLKKSSHSFTLHKNLTKSYLWKFNKVYFQRTPFTSHHVKNVANVCPRGCFGCGCQVLAWSGAGGREKRWRWWREPGGRDAFVWHETHRCAESRLQKLLLWWQPVFRQAVPET